MKLVELSTKVEEVTKYLREHDDPHVRYLFSSYINLFRITHNLTGLSCPKEVKVNPKVVELFDHVYKAYLESSRHKEDYPPPPVTFGDPLVVPMSYRVCRRKVFNHNGVILQRNRILEGRVN